MLTVSPYFSSMAVKLWEAPSTNATVLSEQLTVCLQGTGTVKRMGDQPDIDTGSGKPQNSIMANGSGAAGKQAVSGFIVHNRTPPDKMINELSGQK